jgi:hypothetical protein
VKKDKKRLGIYFHVTTSYYRFMDVFNKRRSLFLLTLVASIISSMLIWLKYCKFTNNIQSTQVEVKMFKFLNI